MKTLETATLAGGCFWCMEALFKRLRGVESVVSGYAGGSSDPDSAPSYEQVSSGATDYAEAIQIKFDPEITSFEKLLDVFWTIHDPTTLNRQGADIGTQYKSAIFCHCATQKEIAEKSKQPSFVTQILPFTNFYKAEDCHQNYYESNRDLNFYCAIVIDPKIKKLMQDFAEDVKEEYK